MRFKPCDGLSPGLAVLIMVVATAHMEPAGGRRRACRRVHRQHARSAGTKRPLATHVIFFCMILDPGLAERWQWGRGGSG